MGQIRIENKSQISLGAYKKQLQVFLFLFLIIISCTKPGDDSASTPDKGSSNNGQNIGQQPSASPIVGIETPSPGPTITPPEIYGDTSQRTIYYGYYLNGENYLYDLSLEPDPVWNNSKDFAPDNNIIMTSSLGIAGTVEKVAQTYQLKYLIDLGDLIADAGGKYYGDQNFIDRFEAVYPTLQKYSENIVAFTLIDEPPVGRSITERDLEYTSHYIKQKFPNILIAIGYDNERSVSVADGGIGVPSDVDVIGFNCNSTKRIGNCDFEARTDKLIQRYPNKQIILYPPSYIPEAWLTHLVCDSQGCRNEDNTQEMTRQVVALIKRYNKYISNTPKVKIVLPFIWHFSRQVQNDFKLVGAREFPLLRNEVKIGACKLINKACSTSTN